MLLIFADESKRTPDSQKLMDDYREFTEGIVRSGHFRAGARLQSISSATTMRETNGKRLTRDGPFAEAKEHLAGYFVVECERLGEAIAIAGRIPALRFGEPVEIRPVVPTPELPAHAREVNDERSPAT